MYALIAYFFRLLTPFRMGLFLASHTYPAMMKLCTVIPYLKKIQKTYKSRNTFPWSLMIAAKIATLDILKIKVF